MDDSDRMERVETRALQAWHAGFSAARIAGYDWRLERIGDALCSVSSSDPSILLNRVLDLGRDGPPGRQQLLDIRRVYEDAGVERFFLHVVPDLKGPDTDALLTETGFEKYRGWMKFARGAGDVRSVHTDLEVRRVGPRQGVEFAAIVAPAFDMSPVSLPLLALLPGIENQTAFMSYDGTRLAGTGVVFVDGETGQLDWGATHVDFRRRGGQTAVLGARLRFAFDAGCASIATMTGEAVPGDQQHSYGNILKSGFSESYLRENWVPANNRGSRE